MSFSRAVAIAFMAAEFGRSSSWGESIGVMFVGALLWFLAPDPLPGAIKRGLEAFAREYRR